MAKKETVMDRARDELFSHINRCGVLQAEDDDQQHWMDETIDYLAERYPDLSDAQLQELFNVGMRFCQPAIPHGRKRKASEEEETPEAEAGEEKQEAGEEKQEAEGKDESDRPEASREEEGAEKELVS